MANAGNTELNLSWQVTDKETGVSLSMGEVVDGQMLLFDVPPCGNVRGEIRLALLWIQDQWKRRIIGGLDAFPYSPEFDRLFSDFCTSFGSRLPDFRTACHAESRKSAFWSTLLNLRKSKRLTGYTKRGNASPSRATMSELQVIRNEIDLPSERSLRERLPYTALFTELYERFHRRCRELHYSSTLNDHEFWRAIVRIMKADRVAQLPDLFGF